MVILTSTLDEVDSGAFESTFWKTSLIPLTDGQCEIRYSCFLPGGTDHDSPDPRFSWSHTSGAIHESPPVNSWKAWQSSPELALVFLSAHLHFAGPNFQMFIGLRDFRAAPLACDAPRSHRALTSLSENFDPSLYDQPPIDSVVASSSFHPNTRTRASMKRSPTPSVLHYPVARAGPCILQFLSDRLSSLSLMGDIQFDTTAHDLIFRLRTFESATNHEPHNLIPVVLRPHPLNESWASLSSLRDDDPPDGTGFPIKSFPPGWRALGWNAERALQCVASDSLLMTGDGVLPGQSF